MNKHFEEYLKRIFSDDECQDKFFCTVPGITDSPAAGVKDGFLTITRAEMRALFDPVISRVVALVQEQISRVEALGRRVSVCYYSRQSINKMKDLSANLVIGGTTGGRIWCVRVPPQMPQRGL